MHELTLHTSLFCVKNVDQIYPRMYISTEEDGSRTSLNNA